MATRNLSRHQIIKSLLAQPPESDAAIKLWEQMAAQIISIVGEDGGTSWWNGPGRKCRDE